MTSNLGTHAPLWRAATRVFVFVIAGVSGCANTDATQHVARAFRLGTTRPDEAPRVLNTELPFQYPVALYARRVQGNVMLRLFLDGNGRVLADSTRVEESSGNAALDSAALSGSRALRFVPSKLHGEAIAAAVLFPVYFRHPEARPLPGDTILNQRGSAR